MRWSALGLCVAALCTVSCVVGVAAQEDFFLEGNRRYLEGDFRGALESYLRIEEAGFESGPLYYNVGNSYFKLGELGSAILYYERALRHMPRDEDVRANLALARSLTADDVTPLPGFPPFRAVRWWVRAIPPPVLTGLVGGAYLIAMSGLILAVGLRGTGPARWGRRAALVGGLVTLLFGINLVILELDLDESRRAVVMAEAADVHSAPADDPSLQVFTVHEGTTVRIDRQSDGWAEIVLEDGQVGWLELAALEEI